MLHLWLSIAPASAPIQNCFTFDFGGVDLLGFAYRRQFWISMLDFEGTEPAMAGEVLAFDQFLKFEFQI